VMNEWLVPVLYCFCILWGASIVADALSDVARSLDGMTRALKDEDTY
jgi:hypothetical protein